MGKADRELTEARKSIYEQSEELIIQEYDNTEQKIDNENNIREDTVLLLKKRLIEYSNNSGLSLCEYLDINNIDNYIQWILNNNNK